MSEHKMNLLWLRTTDTFEYKTYNREHIWQFENGLEIEASAAPNFFGNKNCIDPEEAFVASLSSCHMLTFLAIACKQSFVVKSYKDNAVGVLEKSNKDKLSITRVTLHPKIEWSGDAPSAQKLEQMHQFAHKECFLANSVLTEIIIKMDND